MNLNKKIIIILFIIVVMGVAGYAIYNMHVRLERVRHWEMLTQLIEKNGDHDAYMELKEFFPGQAETMPYSIIMATKYKDPVAFLDVYNAFYCDTTLDDFSKRIAIGFLEEGIKYDTIEQICLLELINIYASEKPVDTIQLMSYINQIKGIETDKARVFLYHKTLELNQQKHVSRYLSQSMTNR